MNDVNSRFFGKIENKVKLELKAMHQLNTFDKKCIWGHSWTLLTDFEHFWPPYTIHNEAKMWQIVKKTQLFIDPIFFHTVSLLLQGVKLQQ